MILYLRRDSRTEIYHCLVSIGLHTRWPWGSVWLYITLGLTDEAWWTEIAGCFSAVGSSL